MSQWVQYKNDPNGKKWELKDCPHNTYTDRATWLTDEAVVPGYMATIELPRSEYVLVDGPERWETCTRDAVVVSESAKALNLPDPSVNVGGWDYMGNVSEGYRWAWSEKDPDALIIQRRV